MRLLFEKMKQRSFTFAFLIRNFYFKSVEYITDIDLIWLFIIVAIVMIVLGSSLYTERQRNRKSDK